MDVLKGLGLPGELQTKVRARLEYLSADDKAFHERLQAIVNKPLARSSPDFHTMRGLPSLTQLRAIEYVPNLAGKLCQLYCVNSKNRPYIKLSKFCLANPSNLRSVYVRHTEKNGPGEFTVVRNW